MAEVAQKAAAWAAASFEAATIKAAAAAIQAARAAEVVTAMVKAATGGLQAPPFFFLSVGQNSKLAVVPPKTTWVIRMLFFEMRSGTPPNTKSSLLPLGGKQSGYHLFLHM